MTTRAFVFPGQGSQAVGMGKDLADASAAAREVFEEVDDALDQHLSQLIHRPVSNRGNRQRRPGVRHLSGQPVAQRATRAGAVGWRSAGHRGGGLGSTGLGSSGQNPELLTLKLPYHPKPPAPAQYGPGRCDNSLRSRRRRRPAMPPPKSRRLEGRAPPATCRSPHRSSPRNSGRPRSAWHTGPKSPPSGLPRGEGTCSSPRAQRSADGRPRTEPLLPPRFRRTDAMHHGS